MKRGIEHRNLIGPFHVSRKKVFRDGFIFVSLNCLTYLNMAFCWTLLRCLIMDLAVTATSFTSPALNCGPSRPIITALDKNTNIRNRASTPISAGWDTKSGHPSVIRAAVIEIPANGKKIPNTFFTMKEKWWFEAAHWDSFVWWKSFILFQTFSSLLYHRSPSVATWMGVCF